MKKIKKYLKYHIIDIILALSLLILFFSNQIAGLIVFALLLVAYAIFRIYLFITNLHFVGKMKNNSTHIYGFKGCGKDLSVQDYVFLRFGKKYHKQCKKLKYDKTLIYSYYSEHPNYLSLTDYGYGCKIVKLTDFELFNQLNKKDLNYNDFINDIPISCKKNDFFEGKQLIISEAQLGLPNTESNALDKKYPWLPVFVALSRHLYNMNIIINSQEFDRPWIKVRNQQDLYIRCLSTFPRGGSFFSRISPFIPILRKYVITTIRVYNERQSAENNLLPFSAKGLINEGVKTAYLTSGQATKEQFEATNGKIEKMILFTDKKYIVYDTRVYHSIIFGSPAPKN